MWLSMTSQIHALEQKHNLMSGNLKGSCNTRVTGLCFPQNLKLGSHIHSPKSRMHKSMGKSRCKSGDLHWMGKAKWQQRCECELFPETPPHLCTESSSNALVTLPVNGGPFSELCPTSTLWNVFLRTMQHTALLHAAARDVRWRVLHLLLSTSHMKLLRARQEPQLRARFATVDNSQWHIPHAWLDKFLQLTVSG